MRSHLFLGPSLRAGHGCKVSAALRAFLFGCAILACSGASWAEKESADNVLVEGTFQDPDDSSQVYQGVPYVWLERYEIHLDIRPVPREGLILALIVGSKGDTRGALMELNGKETVITYSGAPGFARLRCELPGNVEAYEVRLKPLEGMPTAFLSGFQLLSKSNQAESTTVIPQVRVTLVARRDQLQTSVWKPSSPLTEAHPEMKTLWASPLPEPDDTDPQEAAFRRARKNGLLVNEQWFRCWKYLQGWLSYADPQTGLIPRNLRESRDYWNAEDSAADNYPFMVLTSYLLDPEIFRGPMRKVLETESRLTARIGRLPDAWSFSRQTFLRPEPDPARIIFGASEYAKDGILPLTEYLGPSPWLERLLELEDGIWQVAPVKTPFGAIPSENVEINGEQLQVLSRLYWLTGEERHLEYAIRLGDYYLLGNHHPTRDFSQLRLRDHGCEIVSGLCELYVAVAFARPEKKAQYQGPIHEMCDRILAVGRDSRGMLYNVINPKTGENDGKICDTWGYVYNGIYSVYMIDGVARYRQAVVDALRHLRELKDYNWGGVADEYADSIEGALNLYNREPVEEATEWMDSEIHDMWQRQSADGIVEGWHGDGNVARTALMYAFWKTQGMRVVPWRADVCLGVSRVGDVCYVSLWAEKDWEGRLIFDRPRHRLHFRLPLDYPRINQFPEWFPVGPEEQVKIVKVGDPNPITLAGREAWDGFALQVPAGHEVRLVVSKMWSE